MANSLKGDGMAIFTIFIGAIIALVFITSFSDNIFTQTNTATAVNSSVTVSAINVSLAVAGRELNTVTEISNATFIGLQTRGLTLATGIIGGDQTVTLTANDTASALVGTDVNLSYDYNPDGYIDNAGGRSVTLLILIISALAIVVFVIVVMFKFGSINNLVNSRRRK